MLIMLSLQIQPNKTFTYQLVPVMRYPWVSVPADGLVKQRPRVLHADQWSLVVLKQPNNLQAETRLKRCLERSMCHMQAG